MRYRDPGASGGVGIKLVAAARAAAGLVTRCLRIALRVVKVFLASTGAAGVDGEESDADRSTDEPTGEVG